MIEMISEFRGSAKYWLAMTVFYTIAPIVVIVTDREWYPIKVISLIVFVLLMVASGFITGIKLASEREGR